MRNFKQWEQTRYLAWMFRRMNISKEDNKMPSDIYPLPTDPEKIIDVPTSKEDREALLQKAKERLSMLQK